MLLNKKNNVPTVTAIIPSKDRPDGVNVLIDCLRQQEYPQEKLTIIIIDDGSTPAYNIKNGDATIIRHDTSQGAQASRNQAIQRATSQYLFLLDDDVELIGNNFIPQAIHLLENSPNVAAVFGKKYDVEIDKSPPSQREFSTSKPTRYSGDLVATTSTAGPIEWGNQVYLARRDIIANCGGFDAIYGLNGGHSFREESDLHARIRQQGHQLWYLPTIAFNHKIITNGGHGPAVGKRLFWIAHNHLIFLRRYFKCWQIPAIGFLLDVLRYSWVQGRFRHILSMMRGYCNGWKNALRDKGPGQNQWLEQL